MMSAAGHSRRFDRAPTTFGLPIAEVGALFDYLVRAQHASSPDLPDGQITHGPFLPLVQSLLQKYSDFPKPQISLYPCHPVPLEGRIAIVTDVGMGCGGRGSIRRTFGRATNDAAADGEVVWS
jgi:hypothetical protein